MEQDFITAFFELQRQPTALRTGRPLLAYAASISTMVVATYLMQRKLSVSLIEPCFDNLHDLLKNQGVPLDAAARGRIWPTSAPSTTTCAGGSPPTRSSWSIPTTPPGSRC